MFAIALRSAWSAWPQASQVRLVWRGSTAITAPALYASMVCSSAQPVAEMTRLSPAFCRTRRSSTHTVCAACRPCAAPSSPDGRAGAPDAGSRAAGARASEKGASSSPPGGACRGRGTAACRSAQPGRRSCQRRGRTRYPPGPGPQPGNRQWRTTCRPRASAPPRPAARDRTEAGKAEAPPLQPYAGDKGETVETPARQQAIHRLTMRESVTHAVDLDPSHTDINSPL